MLRKLSSKGIILAFAAFTTLFSCQVFSPENGSAKADNEELIEKDLSHKEKTNSEAKSITESISESEKSTNEEPVLIQGISADEGMQTDDMKMEREPEPTIGVVPIDDAVKCIGVSTMSYTSTLCASPTAPMTMTYDATDSYTSPAYTMEYKEATAVEGASPSSGKGFTSEMAGKLTAGEINDFEKWEMWEDIAEGELEAYREIWKINCDDRYSVFVQTKTGSPITDATVKLKNKDGKVVWETKSDNNGRAELWGRFEMSSTKFKSGSIEITHQGKSHQIDHPKSFRNGTNVFEIEAVCDIPDVADIVFTVDATGSMGDEIAFLQAELIDVMNKVKDKHKDIQLRLGSVFYRDFGDTYVTVDSKLDENLEITREFVSNQYADGGGDGPEAVEEAMRVSNLLNWSKTARTRLMFLILDAPPHGDEATIAKIQQYTQEAAAKGIRIIPLVASGGGYDLDKSLEYLMRSCALATNGTYVFLTDHSGIGDAHTAPSTDKYEVETLNELLQRVISQYLYVPECSIEQFVSNQEVTDTSEVFTQILPTPADSSSMDSTSLQISEPSDIFTMKCYPNPATQYFMAETSIQVTEMFLSDNNGKIIERIVPNSTLTRIEVGDLPTGIYHLKAWINEKWASTRIIVTRI